MTYTKKTLSEIKLIHGDYGNFIKGQKLDKKKEKKYKMPPYKDLAASNEIDGEPLDEKCWPGYEKKGMKTMFGKRYPNCVKKKKTRKEEYSDWRSELESIQERKIGKGKDEFFIDSTGKKKRMSQATRQDVGMAPKDPINVTPTGFRAKVDNAKNFLKQKVKLPKSASKVPGVKGAAKLLSKTPKGALVAAGLLGAVAGARAIGRKFNEIRKKRKDAAIDKQVDKYVADRKGPIRKVNYMPDNMYTVKRDKDGKVTGTGDQIRVVPGTRTIKRMPKPGERTSTKSRFSQHTRMKLGNYGSLSPMDEKMDLKKADMGDVITDFRKSDAPQFKGKSDKKIQKMAIAAKLEADGKSLKDEYLPEILDKKDIPHVKKLVGKLRSGSKTHAKQADDLEKAMKENTAIESELVIQDWNVDDIKFTEIETVDIIKPKPLKESMSNWREELDEGAGAALKVGSMVAKKAIPALMTGIGAVGTIMQSKKKEPSDAEDEDRLFDLASEPFKNRNRESESPEVRKNRDRSERRLKEFIAKRKKTRELTKNKQKLEKSYEKNMDNDIKDHYDWREELGEDWQKVNRNDKTDGLSRKAVKAYRRENPGSKLQTAVTKDPKKLKKGSKSAKRRLSFCRRMKGMKKKLTSAKTRRDPDSRINKALRRWNC